MLKLLYNERGGKKIMSLEQTYCFLFFLFLFVIVSSIEWAALQKNWWK